MSVARLKTCRLRLVERSWAFSDRHSDAVAAYWATAIADNPSLFDGDVFVTENWSVENGHLAGEAVATKFSAYLYWREHGFDQGVTSETFASAGVVAADGGIVLVRAVGGTLNGGHYVTPGGLVDKRDVTVDGLLDLAGAAGRELSEETGLNMSDLQREDGFLLANLMPYLCVASVYRSSRSGAELASTIERFLADQEVPEVEDVRVIYNTADLDGMPVAPFARLLTSAILA